MLKITAEYDRDTSLGKLNIFRHLPASLIDVSDATREIWWMNQE
jgi:hypothetical protein